MKNHYEWPIEFYKIFLGETMTYSCADFRHGDDTDLESAQIRKMDTILDAIVDQNSKKILDIGCGWGSTVRRAVSKYGVSAIGIDVSGQQLNYCIENSLDNMSFCDLNLYEYNEPVDGICCIESFEHIKSENYNKFFSLCHKALKPNGRLLIQTQIHEENKINFDLLKFNLWCRKNMMLDLELPQVDQIYDMAKQYNFSVEILNVLDRQYYLSVSEWLKRLEDEKELCINLIGQEEYDYFTYVLRKMGELHEKKVLNIYQFLLKKEEDK